jgi:hypothetical protein
MIKALLVLSISIGCAHAQATFHGCPPEGTAKGDKAALNVLKNRFLPPAPADRSGILLGEILADVGADHTDKGDDSRRFTNKVAAVGMKGWIVDVKLEGPESCNCGSDDPDMHDFHMWLGTSATAAHKDSMVIEITPRVRAKNGWTVEWIKSLKHQHVKVSGWMLWDPLHANMATNSTPDAKLLARKTCWEVHPVTAIEVIP